MVVTHGLCPVRPRWNGRQISRPQCLATNVCGPPSLPFLFPPRKNPLGKSSLPGKVVTTIAPFWLAKFISRVAKCEDLQEACLFLPSRKLFWGFLRSGFVLARKCWTLVRLWCAFVVLHACFLTVAVCLLQASFLQVRNYRVYRRCCKLCVFYSLALGGATKLSCLRDQTVESRATKLSWKIR
jgi:hypothetical protein